MKVLVNFTTGSIYCVDCANKLNLQVHDDQEVIDTWNKLDFQHMYCLKCETEVYEGNTTNGQHLAMFVYN